MEGGKESVVVDHLLARVTSRKKGIQKLVNKSGGDRLT